MKSIEDQWQQFAAAVSVPVGGVQWVETRLAFYAGAWSLLMSLRAFDGPEEDGVRMMRALEREGEAFFARNIARMKAAATGQTG